MSAALHADPFVPNHGRPLRSLSLSEPLGFHTGFGPGSGSIGSTISTSANRNSGGYVLDGQENGDVLGMYRVSLPTMEEESEDALDHARANRTRSYSTSAAFGLGTYGALPSSPFAPTETHTPFAHPSGSLGLLDKQEQHPSLHRKFSVGSTWPSAAHRNEDQNKPSVPSAHRRSITSSSYVSPIWESPAPQPPPMQPVHDRERIEHQRVPRRFSVAPSSGFQTYDHFLESEHLGGSSVTSGYGSRYVHSAPFQRTQRLGS